MGRGYNFKIQYFMNRATDFLGNKCVLHVVPWPTKHYVTSLSERQVYIVYCHDRMGISYYSIYSSLKIDLALIGFHL